MNERGQTANDYLIGIIIVLVTIVAVFGFFPDFYQPFDQAVDDDQKAMAENLATKLVTDNRLMDTQRTLSFSGFKAEGDNPDRLAAQAGLKGWDGWNVTLSDGETSVGLDNRNYGPEFYDGPAATATRYVQVKGGPDELDCSDGCLLIVRVW